MRGKEILKSANSRLKRGVIRILLVWIKNAPCGFLSDHSRTTLLLGVVGLHIGAIIVGVQSIGTRVLAAPSCDL